MASSKTNAKKTGKYRSGFEQTIAQQLDASNIEYLYEDKNNKIIYHLPVKDKKYIPDFLIEGHPIVIIEAKGVFDKADRTKHEMLRDQHPELDIRIVFQNANNKIYKGSKTTYAAWATKNGITWANKEMPKEWLNDLKKGR